MREDFLHYHVLGPEGNLDDHSLERNATLRKPKAYRYICSSIFYLADAGVFIYGVIRYEQKLLFAVGAAIMLYGAARQIRFIWKRWGK